MAWLEKKTERIPGPVELLLTAVVLFAVSACSQEDLPGRVKQVERHQWTGPKVTKIPNPAAGNRTGFGRTLLVHGAEVYASATLLGTGSLFIYARKGTSWSMSMELTAPKGFAPITFGSDPARLDDLLFVGGVEDKPYTKAAKYVFKRSGSTWKTIQKLSASNPAPAHMQAFGHGTVVEKDTLVLGAPGYGSDRYSSGAGAAYIFERGGTQWEKKQFLVASTRSLNADFASANAIDGDTLAISAPGEVLWPKTSGRAGAAYVFVRQGAKWKEEQRIVPSDLKENDWFGEDLDLDGDTLVVGAWGQDERGGESGAAYVFNRTGTKWAQAQKILPADLKKDSCLGSGVAIEGDIMALGAPGDGDQGEVAGAVYIYQRNGMVWKQKHKVHAPGGRAGDFFGGVVAMDYPIVAVRATNIEAIYIIELNVLADHDGGPPGCLDRWPEPDRSAPADRGQVDQAGNAGQGSEQTGCSCSLEGGQRPEPLTVMMLLALACALFASRRARILSR